MWFQWVYYIDIDVCYGVEQCFGLQVKVFQLMVQVGDVVVECVYCFFIGGEFVFQYYQVQGIVCQFSIEVLMVVGIEYFQQCFKIEVKIGFIVIEYCQC